MAEVVLEHLSKTFPKEVQAVRDLSLHIGDGELTVLLGPSGCGKTTTLRLIAGLEEATVGTVRIAGRCVNALAPRDRDVGMVFQRPALYPHRSVRGNLSMSLHLRQPLGPLGRLLLRVARPRRYAELQELEKLTAERVDSTAKLLGLNHLLDRFPEQLSGGQGQRVALGRALVRRPAVFLLDEPLSHLDGPLRAELRHELHLLQRQLRATMIYVTHDQAEAMTLADRVAVMDRGVLQQVDRPLVVYQQPVNRFVASFLGWPAMNFVDGRLLPHDGTLCFVSAFDGRGGGTDGGWSLALPSSMPPAKAACWYASAGRAVTLGIRPEDIQFATSSHPPCQAGAMLTVEVTLVEALGHACLVTIRRGGWQGLALVPGLPTGSGQKGSGRMVEAFFNMEHAHLFDRSTGWALWNNGPAG